MLIAVFESRLAYRTDATKMSIVYSVSQKIPPLAACGFLTFFDKRLRILNQFFAHLLYVPIYTRLQIFIQLSQTSTKLCHIKRDYLVRVICSKCPPSAETHAFRRLRKSLIALLIILLWQVIPDLLFL